MAIYPPLVIRDRKNFGYYTAWVIYIALVVGFFNLVLSNNAWRIT